MCLLAVVESHPDSAIEDLRLDDPFPSLVTFCDSLDLDSMSKKDHSHTPWLVLIYKCLQEWKASVRICVICFTWSSTCLIMIQSVEIKKKKFVVCTILQHDGNPPKNYREKNAFKELLRNGTRCFLCLQNFLLVQFLRILMHSRSILQCICFACSLLLSWCTHRAKSESVCCCHV